MNDFNIYHNRLPLLGWLVIPLILLWLTTNYLIGLNKPVAWSAKSDKPKIVYVYAEQHASAPFTWHNTGLVTLWFDDAWISQYTAGLPLLDRFGYPAALAVPTQLIGYDAYMGWAQVRHLQNRGWEITSHTRTHDCTLYKADRQQVDYELTGSLQDLQQHGLERDSFVSPCGSNSPLMQQIARKNYLSFRTSEPGYNNLPVANPYNLLVQTLDSSTSLTTVRYWLQTAKTNHQWLIIVIHQIGAVNKEYSISSSLLKNILAEIKQQDVPVVLPNQVLALPRPEVSNQPVLTASASAAVQSQIHE